MKNGDQPAIPNALAVRTNDGYMSTSGLTKRELFAAMALQGLLANPEVIRRAAVASVTAGMSAVEGIASVARDHADHLLSELEKSK